MVSKGITLVLLSVLGLAGCGTTTVSPAIKGKEGVSTGFNSSGYPVVKSIVFQRPAADATRVLKCVQTEIDGLYGQPVELDGAVKAKGQTYASVGASYYVAYALTIQGGKYTFDRLNHAGENGPTYELMGSSHGSPENAYAALERITDRVSECSKT